MIFVIGPLFAGKKDYVKQVMGFSDDEFAAKVMWDVQDLAAHAPDLNALAETLAQKEVVIATETGSGVVPVDAVQREAREAAGRLSCLLAARADTVVRVYCGLPQLLKGTWPC